jgi:hypothetical protein
MRSRDSKVQSENELSVPIEVYKKLERLGRDRDLTPSQVLEQLVKSEFDKLLAEFRSTFTN